METIGERIKKIRKDNRLTQEAFAERLGMKRSSISLYELDTSAPSTGIVSLICKEFNVSEAWLRTGEGEPYTKRTKQEELELFFKDVEMGTDEFRSAFISNLAKLSPDEWLMLAKICKKLVSENKPAARDFVYKVDTPEGEKEFLVERTPLSEKKPNDKKTDS